MKNLTHKKSKLKQTTLFFLIVAALLSIGCEDIDGATLNGEQSEETSLIDYSLVPLQEDVHTTVCSTNTYLDERGEEQTAKETYRFAVMNAVLEVNPHFSGFLGIDTVDDCETARAYSKAMNEYIDFHEAIEPPQAAENEGGIGVVQQPIMGGSVVNYKRGLVEIYTPTGSCTGFLLNEDTVITAAHCLADHIASGNHSTAQITVNYFDPYNKLKRRISRVFRSFPIGYATARSDIWIHPNYSGEGNWSQDVGVVQTPGKWINTSSRDYLAVFQGSLKSVNNISLFGRGRTSYNGSSGTLKSGNRELKDFTGTQVKTKAGSVRFCSGDSGAPYFKKNNGDNLVIAVHGGHSYIGSERPCPDWNNSQYGCRINGDKMNWIEDVAGIDCEYSKSANGLGQKICW